MLFFSAFLGGGLGTLIDLIFIKVLITDEYARLGVGSGMGALAGLVIGILLLIPLKKGIVEDYGISYGVGVGTNILIGAIIGIFFGAIFGSLFGLILKAIDFGIGSTTLSYPVFGILIWITLGLNIGVLIGVIASFGLAGIIFGGILAGGLVGTIGMFATFGSTILPAIGAGTGIIAGGLVGLLVKFSINASVGKSDNITMFGWLNPGQKRATERSAGDCCTSGDYGSSTWDCNWGSSDCGGGGEACGGTLAVIGIVILFGVVILLVIFLINFIAWVSTKASIKFGETIKRGALTAIGASFSIFLIIGTNIGLTESFHNVLFKYNLFIGAGIGLIFGILIFLAQGLSIKISQIKISPNSITWKDRHTNGSVVLSSIQSFEFLKEQRSKDTPYACYEDYFKFITQDGNMHKIVINCWKTPNGTNSTDYIQTILQQYIGQNKFTDEQKLEEYYDKLQKGESEEVTIKDTKYSISGYSFSTSSEITNEMVTEVEKLIPKVNKASIYWLHQVTQYPEPIIEEIVTIHLGYRIENGFVKK